MFAAILLVALLCCLAIIGLAQPLKENPLRTTAEASVWSTSLAFPLEALFFARRSGVLFATNATHASAMDAASGAMLWTLELLSVNASFVGEFNSSAAVISTAHDGGGGPPVLSGRSFTDGSLAWSVALPQVDAEAVSIGCVPWTTTEEKLAEVLLFLCAGRLAVAVRHQASDVTTTFCVPLPEGTVAAALTSSSRWFAVLYNATTRNVSAAAFDVLNVTSPKLWNVPVAHDVIPKKKGFRFASVSGCDSVLVLSMALSDDAAPHQNCATLAMDGSDGSILWERRDVAMFSTSFSNTDSCSAVFMSEGDDDDGANMTALESATGNVLWRVSVPTLPIVVLPTSSGVAIWDGQQLYLLEGQRGTLVWKMPFPRPPAADSIAAALSASVLFAASDPIAVALFTCVEPSAECNWEPVEDDGRDTTPAAIAGGCLGVVILFVYYVYLERKHPTPAAAHSRGGVAPSSSSPVADVDDSVYLQQQQQVPDIRGTSPVDSF